MNRRPAPPARLLLGTAVVLALTSGCSGADDPAPKPASPTPTPTTSTTAPASTPSTTAPASTPSGAVTTPPGTTLAFGSPGTVTWPTTRGRPGTLTLTVSSLQQATWKMFRGYQRTPEIKQHVPWFVTVHAVNAGTDGLGKEPLPLRVLDDAGRLVEPSTFADTFSRCPSKPLPKKFPAGAETDACLVFLVPAGATPTAVEHRPDLTTEPVRWTGPTGKVAPDKPKGKDGKKATGKKATGNKSEGENAEQGD